MKSLTSFVIRIGVFVLVFVTRSDGAPLTGSGALLFPGATGDPARDVYLAAGSGSGPFIGMWPGLGPNPPAAPPWVGVFQAIGPMPHTPPAGPPFTGTAKYDFTVGTGGYAPAALPVGTYFQFDDLDNGSNTSETFQLRGFDLAGNPLTTPWLDDPFAATATAVASDMPNYAFVGGLYVFDGSLVPGNPAIRVFLKNNTALGFLEVVRGATTAEFVLAAPPVVPEPTTLAMLIGGAICCACVHRRR
jgi:hypothetical protein